MTNTLTLSRKRTEWDGVGTEWDGRTWMGERLRGGEGRLIVGGRGAGS